MKMNLKLTADELMNVVDAAMDEAMEQELYFDNFGNDNAEEILNVIDAALSAMGIEVSEEVDEEEEDEEEEEEWTPCDDCYHPYACDKCDYAEDEEEDDDPIANMLYVLDDGRTAISFKDACFLMDMIKETGIERGLSEDEAIEAAKTIFMKIGKDYGIDEVTEEEEEEEEEKKPERVGLDLNKPLSQYVFIYKGQRAIKQSDADQIIQAMTKAIEETRLSFLPEEIKQQMRTDMLLKIFEDNGIEIVVRGE